MVTSNTNEWCRDQGPAQLANFSQNINRTYPILGCNVDASREPLLAGVIKPYTIITTPSGIKVGLRCHRLLACSNTMTPRAAA